MTNYKSIWCVARYVDYNLTLLPEKWYNFAFKVAKYTYTKKREFYSPPPKRIPKFTLNQKNALSFFAEPTSLRPCNK